MSSGKTTDPPDEPDFDVILGVLRQELAETCLQVDAARHLAVRRLRLLPAIDRQLAQVQDLIVRTRQMIAAQPPPPPPPAPLPPSPEPPPRLLLGKAQSPKARQHYLAPDQEPPAPEARPIGRSRRK